MGIADKVWDALTTVIRMNDRVDRMAVTIVQRQHQIQSLTERVIRLETALEIGMSRGGRENPDWQIESKRSRVRFSRSSARCFQASRGARQQARN